MTKLHNFVVKLGLFAAPVGVLLQGSGCSKQREFDDEDESDELAEQQRLAEEALRGKQAEEFDARAQVCGFIYH